MLSTTRSRVYDALPGISVFYRSCKRDFKFSFGGIEFNSNNKVGTKIVLKVSGSVHWAHKVQNGQADISKASFIVKIPWHKINITRKSKAYKKLMPQLQLVRLMCVCASSSEWKKSFESIVRPRLYDGSFYHRKKMTWAELSV